MQESTLIVGQKILKIPQKQKPEENPENSENLTTLSKNPKRLNDSIFNYNILVLCINSACTIITYFLHDKCSSLLFFSLVPSLVTIIIQIFFKFYLKKKKLHQTKNMLIQLFLYGLCCLVLLLTDLNILSTFCSKNQKSLIPSIFYLMALSKQTIFIYNTHLRLVICLNTLFGLVSFSLNMAGLQSYEVTLLQTLFFLSLIPFKSLRKSLNYKIQDIYKIEKENEDSTPIENVMKMLTNVLDEFEEMINCHNCEVFARKSFSILNSAVDTLRNTPNIYSTNLENITRGMNEQDKIFIEQSFSDKSIYSSMNDSDDVKENMNVFYGTTDLGGVLKQIGSEWNFNMFFVNDCSGYKPLQVCGEYVFRKYNFDKTYKILEETFLAFLGKLEESYLPNPYHNSCHAADMMCSFLYFINASGFIKKMNSLELFSCVLACMAHDAGHKGKSNRFLILSKDPISLRYNDISVQEMMHSAVLFEILQCQDSNIFAHLHNDNWFSVRKIIIEMILSTDMQKHFEILGVAKAKYTNSLQPYDLNEGEVKLDIFKLGIKCADLGHAAKDIETHNKWCGLLIQEFFDQGDREKELGMPVSMYCDREATDISKSQAGFLQNVVLPVYIAMSSILRSGEIDLHCVAQIKKNKSFWSDRRSLSKNQTVMIKKQQEIKQKEYLELMEKAGGIKRSITPFVVISPN
jgi:hypothetical protein